MKATRKTGVNIIVRALEEPVRQIAANAGLEGSVIVENIKKAAKPGYGYDAKADEYGMMADKGFIDPTKVNPQRTAECGFDRRDGSYDGEPCLRYPRARTGTGCRRHGRRTRDVLIFRTCLNLNVQVGVERVRGSRYFCCPYLFFALLERNEPLAELEREKALGVKQERGVNRNSAMTKKHSCA